MPTDTNPDPTHPIPHSPTYFEQLFAALQARAMARGYSQDPADREDDDDDDDEWDEDDDPLTPPPPTNPVFAKQSPTSPSFRTSPAFGGSVPAPRTSTPVSAEQTPSSPSSPSFPSSVTPSHRATHETAKRTPSPPTSPTPPNSAPTWIGTTHARRLLDVGCEKTVIGWVRYGYLRARVLPNRRTQVLLEDVLRLAQQLSQLPTTPPSQL